MSERIERARFWQLTVDAADPGRLAAFWAAALGYTPTPPEAPATPWNRHYRDRLARSGRSGYRDRLFDPEGHRPPLWFQHAPEERVGRNRLHLDLYPTGRDDALALDVRDAIIDAEVARLVALGATVTRRVREDHHGGVVTFAVLADPEGNAFCVG